MLKPVCGPLFWPKATPCIKTPHFTCPTVPLIGKKGRKMLWTSQNKCRTFLHMHNENRNVFVLLILSDCALTLSKYCETDPLILSPNRMRITEY